MTDTEAMIEDCMRRDTKLTDWERGFVHDIQRKANNLTAMQLARLEEIWERIT